MTRTPCGRPLTTIRPCPCRAQLPSSHGLVIPVLIERYVLIPSIVLAVIITCQQQQVVRGFQSTPHGKRSMSDDRVVGRHHTTTTTTTTRVTSALTTTTLYSAPTDRHVKSLVEQVRPQILDAKQRGDVEILSHDPLIYVVRNLLSTEQCHAYRQYVIMMDEIDSDRRSMSRSNPPYVSINTHRLWPLLLLSIGAGIPPTIPIALEWQQFDSIVSMIQIFFGAALPNIIVALMGSFLLAYGVVLPLLRFRSRSTSRTSDAMALNFDHDVPFIQSLVTAVCEWTGHHQWQCWEAPVVTRYDPGAIFARHGDASPTYGSEWEDLGGQRIVTCICYLNDIPPPPPQNNNRSTGTTHNITSRGGSGGGGETYFDQLKIAVQPKAGHALIFFPADSITWKADDRTTHESLPPIEHEKWIVQMFGRANRVPSPLGLPDNYATISTSSQSTTIEA